MNLIEGENSRFCTVCNNLKLYNNFYKQKQGKYGLQSRCKDCYNNTKPKDYSKEIEHEIKRCSNCNKNKCFSEFYPNNRYRHNLHRICKICVNNKQKLKRLLNNSIKRNYEEFRDKLNQSKFCGRCGEYKSFDNFSNSKNRKYGKGHPCRNCKKEIYQNNKKKIIEKQTKYTRQKRRNCLDLRIKDSLRGRIYKAIKGYAKSKTTEKLLGCTIEEFKTYLERQFEDGMSWDNYGEWHIDHIIPCSWYDLSKPHHQEECFFYTNMQPLWAKDNHRKSDKLNW